VRFFLTVLFLAFAAPMLAAPPRPSGPSVHTADVIGYVTPEQIRGASGEGLPVSALHPRQRQKLPKLSGETRIKFFPRGKGRWGVLLLAPPQVEERKP
jgi:hypothetical protein